MNTLVCLKVGTKYGPEYVNKLRSMVVRHTTERTEFFCITDDAKGLDDGIQTIIARRDEYLSGWWHKCALFGGYKFDADRIVFLDLDTVIVGNIDFLWSYQGDFCILKDFYFPERYGSAVMSIAKNAHREVWDNFVVNPVMALRQGGDQQWIYNQVKDADLWQDLYRDKIVSFKVDCQMGVPDTASIVCFHGVPRPHEVRELSWMKENWR